MIKILRKEDGSYIVMNGHGYALPDPVTAMKKPIAIKARRMDVAFSVETLEGTMDGNIGDYLMTGVNGELYPCAGEIFEKSYDVIDPEWHAGEEETHS